MGELTTRQKAAAADPRLQKFVLGIRDGKSMRQAALQAGYSEDTASNAYRQLMPRTRALFGALLEDHIPLDEQARLLAEGMKAKETKFFAKDGIVTDEREVIAWGARHAFMELAQKVHGHLPERMELTGEDGGELVIKIIAVGRE